MFGARHPAFGSVGASLERLFAVAIGDVVSDTFDAVDQAQREGGGQVGIRLCTNGCRGGWGARQLIQL